MAKFILMLRDFKSMKYTLMEQNFFLVPKKRTATTSDPEIPAQNKSKGKTKEGYDWQKLSHYHFD